jgi:hypothetical protein
MVARGRVRGYRVRQRASGLRLIHLWVPDTRSRSFAAECRRQCSLLRSDVAEAEALKFIDDANARENEAAR